MPDRIRVQFRSSVDRTTSTFSRLPHHPTGSARRAAFDMKFPLSASTATKKISTPPSRLCLDAQDQDASNNINNNNSGSNANITDSRVPPLPSYPAQQSAPSTQNSLSEKLTIGPSPASTDLPAPDCASVYTTTPTSRSSSTMLSPEGQGRRGGAEDKDDNNNNNNNKNNRSKTVMNNLNDVRRSSPGEDSASCSDSDSATNTNLNMNRNQTKRSSRAVKNDNSKDTAGNTERSSSSSSSRRASQFRRIDSGISSSSSEEDAGTDRLRSCQCGSGSSPSRTWHGGRFHRSPPPRKLSLSRTMSWSSLDSAVGSSSSSATSPTASSFSSLSSLWSSSRTNLSCNPSLDSLLFNGQNFQGPASVWDDSSLPKTDDGEPRVPTPSTKAETPDSDSQSQTSCEATARTSGPSAEDTSRPAPVGQDSTEEAVPEDTTPAYLSGVSPATRRTSDTVPSVTSPEEALTPASQAAVRSPHVTRRRHRHRDRDQNNNTGTQRGSGPLEFLPSSPCRLGDCFSTKGVLSFAALIVYTLTLMVLFWGLGALGKGFATVVGKQDLKEMRRHLAQSRRSRRAPATSG